MSAGSARCELITCDLICYGVASPASFRHYLDMLGQHRGSAVERYAHRGSGIPDRGDETAWFEDGSSESGTTRTRAWTRLWYANLLRESCTVCGFHSLDRPGDLTIGDYWGIDRVIPGFADGWGTSCVIANDERGLALLWDAFDSLDLVETRVEDVANDEQPMLSHPPRVDVEQTFWRIEREQGFESACGAIGIMDWRRRIWDAADAALGLAGSIGRPHRGDREIRSRRQDSPAAMPSPVLDCGTADLPRAFAARNRSDEIRRQSSSGGVFHALASHVISRGGIVYGCAFDAELRAVHMRCETMEDVLRCMGSKYTQSDMGDVLGMVGVDLAEGRTVLFTGTPCQVAAARALHDPGAGLPDGSSKTGDGAAADPRVVPELFRSREECCGCTACAAACPVRAISMEPDDHGFPYPAIDDERCIGCGICASICPFKKKVLR